MLQVSVDPGVILRIAVLSGNVAAVADVLRHNPEAINSRNRAQLCSLLLAARLGFCDVAGYLTSAGADVDAETPAGETPLLLAVKLGNVEMVRRLIAAGANVSHVTNNG